MEIIGIENMTYGGLYRDIEKGDKFDIRHINHFNDF